jgi:hypothetical protein
MTDLPDDEAQPGSRAWIEQTAQLDNAMATARCYLSALNAQDHPACNAILVELACDRDGSMVKAFMALAAQAPGREQPASKPMIVRDPAPAVPQPQEPASKGRPRAKPKVADWEDGGPTHSAGTGSSMLTACWTTSLNLKRSAGIPIPAGGHTAPTCTAPCRTPCRCFTANGVSGAARSAHRSAARTRRPGDRDHPVHTGGGPIALGDGGRRGGQDSSSSSMHSAGS